MSDKKISFKDLYADFKRFAKDYAAKSTKKHSEPTAYGFEPEFVDAPGAPPIDSEMPGRSGTHHAVKLIRYCALFAIGCLVFANIKPYVNITAWLGSGLSDMGILPMLMQFPPIAWLLTTGAALTAFVAGFLLWGLLQGLQMLPVIIMDDPESLLVLMSWIARFKGIAYKKDDTAALRQLKQQFNAIPMNWLESAQQARSVSYIVDAVLCFGFYPPIVGGYERLGVVLSAPTIADIDWRNVAASIAAMFGVEVLYKIWKLLTTALDLMAETTARREAL
jgi:hypothetical protein